MVTDEKIIKLTEIATEANIDAGELATLLSLMGKLDYEDVTKVIWSAIGTANALNVMKQKGKLK